MTATADRAAGAPVPRRADGEDYTEEAARARREFVRTRTGVDLRHVGSYSVDPGVLPGNIENVTGVDQVRLGIAEP